jgi:hypothetical protein
MKKLWIVILIVAIVGCGQKKERIAKMPSDDKPGVTYCVGRHLINLPDYFAINPVSTGSFKTADVDRQRRALEVVVRRGSLTLSEFSTEIQKRRLELKNADNGSVDVLEQEKALDDYGTIFRIRKIGDAYVSEINLLRGGSLVTVKLNSFRRQYALAEDALMNFAARIRVHEEKISPTLSDGFCLGPVIIVGDFESESGSISFNDDKGQNFDVEVDTYAPDPDVPLLRRMSGPDSLLSLFQVKHTVLRAGERTIAGMRAQEWLGWAKLSDEEGAKTLKFALDTLRPKPSKATPRIELTFDTAQPLKSGLPTNTVVSDDEAIQLWDSVVSSIRPVTQ